MLTIGPELAIELICVVAELAPTTPLPLCAISVMDTVLLPPHPAATAPDAAARRSALCFSSPARRESLRPAPTARPLSQLRTVLGARAPRSPAMPASPQA